MLIPIFENGKKIHQDSSGNKYQYDLTNSMDQFSYSTDLRAQMRDKSSITTTRNPKEGEFMSNFFNSLFSDKGEIKGIDNQYSVSEIVNILKEEGYSINVIQDNFLVFRLQGTNVVVVPHDGGDIQFCIMYDDDENRFSLRKVNKINIDYRLGKFYLTDDDKLGIELLLRNDGNGVTKSQIIQGLSDISLLNGLAKKEFW